MEDGGKDTFSIWLLLLATALSGDISVLNFLWILFLKEMAKPIKPSEPGIWSNFLKLQVNFFVIHQPKYFISSWLILNLFSLKKFLFCFQMYWQKVVHNGSLILKPLFVVKFFRCFFLLLSIAVFYYFSRNKFFILPICFDFYYFLLWIVLIPSLYFLWVILVLLLDPLNGKLILSCKIYTAGLSMSLWAML